MFRACILMHVSHCVSGPEYLKKRALQEVAESNENADTRMHEPLLAEDSAPTPPDSPFIHEMEGLRPSSAPARTPSPSPAIVPQASSKEAPNLLSPGSWNGDKTSRGSSRAGSRPSSRPSTPSSNPAAPPAASALAPEDRVPSRTPSRQSAKAEQGSDMEIKGLQKMNVEPKAAAEPAPAATPVRTSLVVSTDDEEPPRPASKPPPKAVTPEMKPAEVKRRAETRELVNELPAFVMESKPEYRTEVREEKKATTNQLESKPSPKREPSPAPKAAPKPEPKPEPKPVVKPVAKPVAKVEAKNEMRQRSMVKAPSEITQESMELDEVWQTSRNVLVLFGQMFIFTSK